MSNYKFDRKLTALMYEAAFDDLAVLADHLTDNGQGRISLATASREMLEQALSAKHFTHSHCELMAAEIQSYGGNSIANLFRGGAGVSYMELLTDVAKHLRVSLPDYASEEEAESAIMSKMLQESFERMSEEDRQQLFQEVGGHYTLGSGPVTMMMLQAAIKASGFAAFKYTAILANAVARSLLGRGLAFGATAPLMKGISVFAGPVGWAVTAVWTLYDLGSPAFRITVPCVIQLAYMRQKQKYEASQKGLEAAPATTSQAPQLPAPNTMVCPSCHLSTDKGKFCRECGAPLGQLRLS